MAGSFDDDGFSLKPKNLNDYHWFYEGKKGLTVAYRAHGTLQSIVGIVEIPWRALKPSIERHQKYERRKARRK